MPVGFSTGIFIIDPKAEARKARAKPKSAPQVSLWGWVKAHIRRKDGRIEKVKAHRRIR